MFEALQRKAEDPFRTMGRSSVTKPTWAAIGPPCLVGAPVAISGSTKRAAATRCRRAKFKALQRKAEDPSLLGPRASGELWIYEEGRASTRRVPCFRGRDGTSMLPGPRVASSGSTKRAARRVRLSRGQCEAVQREAEDPFLLGQRTCGELWIYEEGGDNEMPACAACC